jgi:hypothetical protein
MLGGVLLSVGRVLSLTTMLKVQLALLPSRSTAVQLTTLVPVGKLDPLEGEQELLAIPPQLSDAIETG